jgi:hypothetical protein
VNARETIGCLAFVVFLPVAPCAVFRAPRAAAVLFLLGVALALIAWWLSDRARRRPSSHAIAHALDTYRQNGSNAIEVYAREHLEKQWKVERFVVMAERRFRTWFGGERVELDVDLGFSRAYVTIELEANSGWLVRTSVKIKPEHEGTTIAADEALAVARADAAQRSWSLREPVQVTRFGGAWTISTNRGMKGANAQITVDAATGVVVSRAYAPR